VNENVVVIVFQVPEFVCKQLRKTVRSQYIYIIIFLTNIIYLYPTYAWYGFMRFHCGTMLPWGNMSFFFLYVL